MDYMWQILSTFSEEFLCDSSDGLRRHEHWRPCRRDRDVHKASLSSEWLSLRRIRRLDRRIRHCCRAWSAPLQAQIGRDLKSLMSDFPALREVDASLVSDVVVAQADMETAQRLECWRSYVH